jgi:LmbE family N-acetylglucosaminyl deacetylase
MDSDTNDGQRVLVVGAHPDDPEFGCAATVAKWVRQGKEVHYLLLTSGDKGSHDPHLRAGEVAALRECEQRNAARVLGVASVTFMRHPDGLLEANLPLRQQVCAEIRRIRPHFLVAIDPWRRYQLHPDHRAAGQVALDAAWAAREWGIFPEQLADGEDPWRISEAYLFWTDSADHWEDVSETVDVRIEALKEHKSQVGERLAMIEEYVREATRQTGEPHGMAYAEAFKRFTRF